MSNERLSVSGPVTVESDSKQRVAFELMKHIGVECLHTDKEAQRTKDYWLKLYRQCYKATKGLSLEAIQKED